MIRWNYLLPRAVLVLSCWLFFAFALDPLLHRTTVATAETVLQAKVDLVDLETGLFPPAVSLQQMQLANRNQPDRNLLQFDTLHARIAGTPLLHRRTIIEEATVTGVRWDTPREASGQLEGSTPGDGPITFPELWPSLSLQAERWGRDLLLGALDEARDQLDPNLLESVRTADRVHREWDERFRAYEMRVRTLQLRVAALQEGVENVKGSAFEKLQAYQKTAAEVNELLAESQRLRKEFPGLIEQANADFREIDAARQRDEAAIREKLKLFQLNPQELTETLLGPEFVQRAQQVARYAAWAKQNLDAATDPPEAERMRGTDIDFSSQEPLPKFLVRRMHISGQMDLRGQPVPFAAEVTGITSEPRLHDQPMVIQLQAEGEAALKLEVVADHRSDQPAWKLELDYRNPQPAKFALGRRDQTGLQLVSGDSRWNATLELVGDDLRGAVVLRQNDVRLDRSAETPHASETARMLAETLAETLAGVKQVEASLQLTGTLQQPRWSLQSDLGRQLATGMNAMIAGEMKRRQEELTAGLNARLQEKTGTLQQMMNERYSGLIAGLDLNETNARGLVQRVAGGKSLGLGGLLRQ